ncbi:MAG: glutamyl-tRNA reductase [Pseudomonadota bacterium]
MPVFVTGISHHTAPLEVRERLAITPGAYAAKVDELRDVVGLSEAVILSTCNRTELYGVVPEDLQGRLVEWLLEQGGMPVSEADGLVYQHDGREAVQHLFRVACGLDSMVIGEPQIMGQLKDAWQAAREAGGLGKTTDRLFQRAFAVSKDVRTNTGINDHPVSVAYIAAILARQIFGDLSQKVVQLVGAGEMITLCGHHFRQKAVGGLRIANRSIERAESLALELQAEAGGLDSLPERLFEADIVIACTGATEPVISRPVIEKALKQRRRRPMFLVDLGVPRDIEPAAAKLSDIYLYTVDDLRKVADESLDKRQSAAREARDTIDHEVQEFLRWVHGARAAAGLRQLRASAEQHATELAERALHQIEAGGDPEAAVRQLSNTLTHRILHGPSTRLRRAAEEQHDDILRAADWLFEGELDPEAEVMSLDVVQRDSIPREEDDDRSQESPRNSAADGAGS